MAVVVINVSCTENPQLATYKEFEATHVIYEKNLSGSWTRSFEEELNQDDVEVYRPTESKEFLPAWFRLRYVFNEDRSCEWLVLHSSDAHYMTTGTWGVDPLDKKVILIYDPDGIVVEYRSFRIVELTGEILRVKRISN